MLSLLSFLGCHPGEYCWILRLSDKDLLTILNYVQDYRQKRDLALVCRKFNELLQHSYAWDAQRALSLQLCLADSTAQQPDSLTQSLIRRRILPSWPALARYLRGSGELSRRVCGNAVSSNTDFIRHVQFILDKCHNLQRLDFSSLDTMTTTDDGAQSARQSLTGSTERKLVSLEAETFKIINRALPMNRLRRIQLSVCALHNIPGLSQPTPLLQLLDRQHVQLRQCQLQMGTGRWPIRESDCVGEQERLLDSLAKCTRLTELNLPELMPATLPKLYALLKKVPTLTRLGLSMRARHQELASLLNVLPADTLQQLGVLLQLEAPENFWLSIMPSKLTRLTELELTIETERTGSVKMAFDLICPAPIYCPSLNHFHIRFTPNDLWIKVLPRLGEMVVDWLGSMSVERAVNVHLYTKHPDRLGQYTECVVASLQQQQLGVTQLVQSGGQAVIEVCNSAFGPYARLTLLAG